MNSSVDKPIFWKTLFYGLVIAYCLFYAPYGVNETDGGFLTGLAWQLVCGKMLYADVVYVRPPLPIWFRLLELKAMPESWAVLGERWLFYVKVACYAWLGAALLIREKGKNQWVLATFGFVLSAHCYPAAAWHTVDGILFSVLSLWCWVNWRSRFSGAVSGVFIAGALLCKQSFYPMLVVWLLLLLSSWHIQRTRILVSVGAMVLTFSGFLLYLNGQHLVSRYWQLTSGAASIEQAFQHGVLDYFQINPVVSLPGLLMLLLFVGGKYWSRWNRWIFWIWSAWLVLLIFSYGLTVWQRQEFTVPFAQTRALFLFALGFGIYQTYWKYWSIEQGLRYASLLAVSWCAAVSWGYNLPVLFAVPWVYAVWIVSGVLLRGKHLDTYRSLLQLIALAGLLVVFRLGYEFVYRDGKRAFMTEHLGAIFPRLSGIYTNRETANMYKELNILVERYGPSFKILPAFPLANYITSSRPPLPLDWVVERETGAGENQVETEMHQAGLVFFIEKAMLEPINTDPEMVLTRTILQKGRIVETTDYFVVLVL